MYSTQVRIVNNQYEVTQTLEEQINEVLIEMSNDESILSVKDIKVLNEHKVLIIYRSW